MSIENKHLKDLKDRQDRPKVDPVLVQALGIATNNNLDIDIHYRWDKDAQAYNMVRDFHDISISGKDTPIRWSDYLHLYQAFPSILHWSIENEVKLKYIAKKGDVRTTISNIDAIERLNNLKIGTAEYEFAYDHDVKKNLVFYPARTDLPADKNFWKLKYEGGMIPSPENYEYYVSPEVWHFVTDNPIGMIEKVGEEICKLTYPIKQDTFSKAEAGVIIQDYYGDYFRDRIFVITASSEDIDFDELHNQD